MKSLLILLSLFSTLTFAQDLPLNKWTCIAGGMQDMVGLVDVYGEATASKADAEKSAMIACVEDSRYLSYCYVEYCFEE